MIYYPLFFILLNLLKLPKSVLVCSKALPRNSLDDNCLITKEVHGEQYNFVHKSGLEHTFVHKSGLNDIIDSNSVNFITNLLQKLGLNTFIFDSKSVNIKNFSQKYILDTLLNKYVVGLTDWN